MNKVFLIGNLTRDPETKTTSGGISLCEFTIAVNRRRSSSAAAGQPEADFIRVTAWRQLGENCARYLAKGRKVAVTGSVSASAYISKTDGQPRAQLEVQADDVEFLTPKGEAGDYSAPAAGYPAAPAAPAMPAASAIPQGNSFTQVEDDELPF